MVFLKWLATLALDFVWGKASTAFKQWLDNRRKAEEAKREAENSVDALKKAVTADEIDKATDSTLNGV